MFRKYYKDANDDIKPSEAFVNSVIRNAEKAKNTKPPAQRQYIKYAASAAAAVFIVSAAVTSMPLWQKVSDREDDMIQSVTMADESESDAVVEEKQERAVPKAANSTAKPDNVSAPSANPPADEAKPSGASAVNTGGSSRPSSKDTQPVKPQTAPSPRSVSGKQSDVSIAEGGENAVAADTGAETAQVQTALTESAAGRMNEISAVKEVKEEVTENETAEEKAVAPPVLMRKKAAADNESNEDGGELYKSQIFTAAASSSSSFNDTDAAVSEDAMLGGSVQSSLMAASVYDDGYSMSFSYDEIYLCPPEGYYTTEQIFDTYTFENGSGAVINAELGESETDSEPSYDSEGDNIHAYAATDGVSVTVDAYMAEMSSVEEVVEQIYE